MIQFLLDNGLSPCVFFLLGVLLLLVAIRMCSTRGRSRSAIVLAALGFVAASAPSVVPIPVALTNAALLKLPAGLVTIPIARFGVNTPGDAPVTWWTANTSGNCAGIGMTSDVGSCNDSADGFAFVTTDGASGADVREWAVKFDGSTDNSTALQSAWTWEASTLGALRLPATPLPALFATPVTATIGSAQTFEMLGTGSGSMLEYTGSSGTAFTPTENGAINNSLFNFRDFTLMTPHAGGANAITATYTGVGNNEPPAVSTFNNVTLRGADGFEQTDYWANGIQVTGGISWVNFLVNIVGPSGTPEGTGISVAGNSTVTGIVYNIQPGSNLSQLSVGISVGNNSQGYQISGTNFTDNGTGISVPSGETGVFQIAVTNSQFGPCFFNCVATASDVTGWLFSNNMVFPGTHTGLALFNSDQAVIVGNTFLFTGTANVGNGVSFASTVGDSGLVANNNFTGMDTAIIIGSGVINLIVGPNAHSLDSGFTYIENNSGNFTNTGPDIYASYTPSSIGCGSGSATFTSTGGTFNVVGNTVTLDLKIVVNVSSSCNQMNVALPSPFNDVAVATAGSGSNITAGSGFFAQLGAGSPSSVNLLTGSVTSGDTYVAHLSYQAISPF
jgi:hypothetical protein